VDLDRYLAIHRPAWERLAGLTQGGRRKIRNASASDIAEMVRLYQQASTDLSVVRGTYRDGALIAYLSGLVSTAGTAIYGSRPRRWRDIARFFSLDFPAAVYRARKFVALAAALTFIPAVLMGVWIDQSPTAAERAAPPALRDAYINHEFEDYYESEHASQFATKVYTNNVGVAITAYAMGIFGGIPTAYILVSNGASVGFAGGLFTHFGQAGKFWGLITPHGLIELTSVVLAGGAGLQVGWALIAPGDRKRSTALREEGRRAIVMIFGLFFSLAIAGFIEGFVTGQPWPTAFRIGIGVTVEIAFLTYLVIRGRIAFAQGLTGALGEHDKQGWAIQRS
jgi:uncharacterized membrane protein SpoIIM required for sporulation